MTRMTALPVSSISERPPHCGASTSRSSGLRRRRRGNHYTSPRSRRASKWHSARQHSWFAVLSARLGAMGKGRKRRRRVAPRTDGGAGLLTASALANLRWADAMVHGGEACNAQSRLVLGDSSPFVSGELAAAWVGDGDGFGWRTLYVRYAQEDGVVRSAQWLADGRHLSAHDKKLLSTGKMRCVRCHASDRAGRKLREEGESEEESEEEGEEAGPEAKQDLQFNPDTRSSQYK